MKHKLALLILVIILLISISSCGGKKPAEEPNTPVVPETALTSSPETLPTPETPAEQEPISLEFDVLYADFAGLSDYRSETVMVVSNVTQYRLLCNSLVDMEALFYKYNKEFFEDHYLLFCCLERGYSEHFEISGVAITPDGELTITGNVYSPETQSWATIEFASIISIPNEIKITNPEDICVWANTIEMTDVEFREFMDSLQNKTEEEPE